MAFKLTQKNGDNFRAQVLRNGSKCILWIAESEDEVYIVNFDKAISADIYQPRPDEDDTKAILLYECDNEISTIEIGNFSKEDALKFLTWFQTSISSI